MRNEVDRVAGLGKNKRPPKFGGEDSKKESVDLNKL